MPRLRQANAKLIFCVTLREYSNTPTLSSVKQKIGDAVAVLRLAYTFTEPEVRYQNTLLPLFAAILYQRILSFVLFPSWFPSVHSSH